MRGLRWVAAVCGLLVVVGARASEEAVAASPCASDRARAVAREGNVRVVRLAAANAPHGASRYYACRGRGSTYVARTTDVRYIGRVKIRWPFVGYDYGDRVQLSSTAGLAVWSARTKRTRRCMRPRAGTEAAGSRTTARLARLGLTGLGDGAFSATYITVNDIDPATTTHEVWRLRRSGCDRLDAGPDVDPRSLALRGDQVVSWRHGDVERTARLR